MDSQKAPGLCVVKAHDRHSGLEIDCQKKSQELTVGVGWGGGGGFCEKGLGRLRHSQAAEITDSHAPNIKLKQWCSSSLIVPADDNTSFVALKTITPAATPLSKIAA